MSEMTERGNREFSVKLTGWKAGAVWWWFVFASLYTIVDLSLEMVLWLKS